MTGEVVLSAALRSNLLSLQRTQASIDKTQGVLSTGLKVSSALDNPQSFFASQALKNRSSDLTRLLDGIGQSIQTIKAADAGVTSLTKLVEQAQSIVDSAREAVTGGTKEAVLTSTKDLKGTTDVNTLTGVTATDSLDFVYINDDGTTRTPASVAIAAADSIEQIITKINDLTDTSGDQVFEAKLNSEGQLSIKGLQGRSFDLTFNSSAGTAGGVEDQALAAAFGFGHVAKVTETGVATLAVKATAVASTKLTSGAFYDATSGFAQASDALFTVKDAASGGGAFRFITAGASATDSLDLEININDKAVQTIGITSTTTIQGLVDGINTNTSLNPFIKATYDDQTGQFAIEAISAEVQTVQITANENPAGGAGTAVADFDFGVNASFASGGAGGAEGDTYVLASAASVLSQYENDYNTVRDQIDGLVKDASYRGVNLLNGDDLDTFFNEDRSNKLSTSGSDLSAAGLGLNKANFSRLDTIASTDLEVRAAQTTLRSFGGTLSNSLSIIQTREDFTKSLVNTLTEGSDKLTLADQNEEGAKLLALQTRQQLGVTALSLAAQAQQSVLRLF